MGKSFNKFWNKYTTLGMLGMKLDEGDDDSTPQQVEQTEEGYTEETLQSPDEESQNTFRKNLMSRNSEDFKILK